jgi:hypothetical protein
MNFLIVQKLYDYFLILKTYPNDFLFKNLKILLFVDCEILNFYNSQISHICILETDCYF